MLAPENKLKRLNIPTIHLSCFQTNPKNFYRRLITQDKTWKLRN